MAAIEHPFGLLLGLPGDREHQTAVLRATLKALEDIRNPGGVVDLPFKWSLSDVDTHAHPPVPPPIVSYLQKHPLQVFNLIRRQIPEA